jgi:hypothetical protein
MVGRPKPLRSLGCPASTIKSGGYSWWRRPAETFVSVQMFAGDQLPYCPETRRDQSSLRNTFEWPGLTATLGRQFRSRHALYDGDALAYA